MTKKEFLEQFACAPFDDRELAEIASKFEGEVGEKSKAFIQALIEFYKVLESIGYERG